MNVQSILFLEHLTDEEIAQHECSDRVWLPRGQFEHVLSESEPGVVSVLKLSNRVGQSVTGMPYAMHHNDSQSTIYIPEWMLKRLDCDHETIRIERIRPGLCTQLTIQPYTSTHLQCDDPLESLRNAFEHYTCLESGYSIPLWIDTMATVVKIDIHKTQPTMNEPLCIRNGTLDLELLRPLDYVSPPPSPVPRPPTPIPEPIESILPPPPLSLEERRERAAAAAEARRLASKN